MLFSAIFILATLEACAGQCYATEGGAPIPSCTCDSDCGSSGCGYSDNPSGPFQCLNCASGLPITSVTGDGTSGFCDPCMMLASCEACTAAGCSFCGSGTTTLCKSSSTPCNSIPVGVVLEKLTCPAPAACTMITDCNLCELEPDCGYADYGEFQICTTAADAAASPGSCGGISTSGSTTGFESCALAFDCTTCQALGEMGCNWYVTEGGQFCSEVVIGVPEITCDGTSTGPVTTGIPDACGSFTDCETCEATFSFTGCGWFNIDGGFCSMVATTDGPRDGCTVFTGTSGDTSGVTGFPTSGPVTGGPATVCPTMLDCVSCTMGAAIGCGWFTFDGQSFCADPEMAVGLPRGECTSGSSTGVVVTSAATGDTSSSTGTTATPCSRPFPGTGYVFPAACQTTLVASGTRCTPIASTGYTCSGLTPIICSNGVLSSPPAPTCTREAACTAPTTTENGVTGCYGTFESGTECALVCNSGFTKTRNHRCNDGVVTAGACAASAATDCISEPDAVTNGLTPSCGPTVQGGSCLLTCQPGYVASSNFACTAAAWNAPRCEDPSAATPTGAQVSSVSSLLPSILAAASAVALAAW